MIDVSHKDDTNRQAVAEAVVELPVEILNSIKNKTVKKGDVFSVSEIAGIMAAKKTSEILPLCHQIPLSGVKIYLILDFENICLKIRSYVTTSKQKTGVEMEALMAVSVAALNVYDMCKYFTHDITISGVKLLEKSGGKSGYKTSEKGI